MITKIFCLADIHIPNSEDQRPYSEMLKQAIAEVYKETKELNKNEYRIVVAGDIFHNKIRTSNEAIETFHMMLNYLNAIGKTYIIAGNHDMLENNLDRLDSISPTFGIKDVYPNVIYLDKELDYKSGIYEDENITFALYSIFNSFNRPPELDEFEKGDSKIIGLYHGDMAGTVTDSGRCSENGINPLQFKGCDAVIAGHIHKYQQLIKNDIPIIYCGSLLQQNSGENVSKHGFVILDVENMNNHHIEVTNNYKIYKFKLSSYEDVQNNIEQLINC
jgi:DNA repair exonuclease SbcCD nuclease subunit